MWALITSALQALASIPKIIEAIEKLSASYIQAQVEAKIAEMKLTKEQINGAKTPEEKMAAIERFSKLLNS
ncbi:MAG TPA: hypothetical protein PKW79_00305 [Rhabdochlamydiaceae bacterium]|nr:hypothetical protein [Rhabdochlamydiaceae bacterium]